MQAEEAEVQFNRLFYVIPTLDEIFTAMLYFIEAHY